MNARANDLYPPTPSDGSGVDPHALSASTGPTKRYRVLMELGHGGMGVVRLAMSRGPQGFVKLIVLKTLHPHLLDDQDSQRRLLEEARIAACLAHPNVVQVYEVIQHRGTPTIVMEYLEGQSLWTIQKECSEPLPLTLKLFILCKVLAGLQAAHTLEDYSGAPLKLVHRDVSPHNVFVLYDGQVKVLDFGIAKTGQSEIETAPGLARGKLHYMAPEQLDGSDLDHRVDIFSVGVMLWEMLTGRSLWSQQGDGAVALRLMTKDLPRLEDPSVPEDLRAICNRALAGDREERYATAEEFQLALGAHLAGQEERALVQQLAAFLERHFRQSRRTMQQLIKSHVQHASEPPVAASSNDSQVEPTQTVKPKPRGNRSWVALGLLVAAAGTLGFFVVRRPAPSPKVTSSGLTGAGTPACGPDQKFCGGECVSIDRPEYGCGSSGCRPCQIENATPRCDFNHACGIAVCYQDYDDCNRELADGCEASVRIDPDHCGGCGQKCPELPHAERGCGDSCTIWRCEAGYADCNERSDDGCEVQTSSHAENCGRCGVACPKGQRCTEGKCGS